MTPKDERRAVHTGVLYYMRIHIIFRGSARKGCETLLAGIR